MNLRRAPLIDRLKLKLKLVTGLEVPVREQSLIMQLETEARGKYLRIWFPIEYQDKHTVGLYEEELKYIGFRKTVLKTGNPLIINELKKRYCSGLCVEAEEL